MSLYKKILNAKKKMGAITKDSKNPFFKSKYFDINKLLLEVEPILQDEGLLLLQPISDGKVKSIVIDTESGEKESSEIDLGSFSDPQKMGSAITYYRRYTLQSLLGLQAEDDDGNKADKAVKEDRKPALTLEQFDKSKKGTKIQISKVLNHYRMSGDQRNELTKLMNDGRE